ncbi:MAG: DUF1704 domain-containing protein [Polyangiaceae bacterium]|nr:DUF1704 domain-containing protein [Polyangiaceae bacterium]
MTTLWRGIARGLTEAERRIALVERCRPLGLRAEQARLAAAWQRGEARAPRWELAPAPNLSELRALLEAVADRVELLGGVGGLYADRARELALEAQLAERIGTPEFAKLADRRFAVDRGDDGAAAETWAHAWVRAGGEPEPTPLVETDDETRADSLLSLMQAMVGELRLPFRVTVSPDLMSAAATGDGVIVIRGGARLSTSEAERIVHHEVVGHALPRVRAGQESCGIFSVGTAQGSDDEEGRALLIERRLGYLGEQRRAELGQRHLAALSVRRGADFVETVRLLLEVGARTPAAVAVATRVHRGGGLAREIVYLTALSRVTRCLEADLGSERFLERGRVAVAALPCLRELEDAGAFAPVAAE